MSIRHSTGIMRLDKSPTQHAKNKESIDFSSFKPRERILAAALKLFVDQGYFNTNVPDLSRESKCSVGSIYHTFKNKEEVAKALYQEGLSAFRSALFGAIEHEEDIEQIIKILVQSFLEFSEINHQLSRYLWLCRHNEFMSGIIKHPTMVGFDPLGRKLAQSIKKAIKNKRIRPIKAPLIWTIVFGLPLAYIRDWLDGYNNAPPRKVSEELAETCWRAINCR